jgi:N-acetylglutamate synthase-like GNAT family acetyltransferase
MINYILLYKIRKRVKRIIKEKITDEWIATTEKSCIGCLADEISWEIYYLLKDNKQER